MRNVIIICGYPGSGKGTQSKLLAEKYAMLHISTGELMRKEIDLDTDLGKQFSDLFKKGQLATDEMAITILEKEMSSRDDVSGFILDGFPRTKSQITLLELLLDRLKCQISNVFVLEISDKEELVSRIIKRGEKSNRPDDSKPNIIRERLKIYDEQTYDVIKHYKSMSLYRAVNGLLDAKDVLLQIEKFLIL